MYEQFKAWVIKILRVPPEPANPLGEEASLQVFRASPDFYRYRMLFWKIGTAISAVVYGVILLVLLIMGIVAAPAALLLWLLIPPLLALAAFQIGFSYATLRLDYEMRWYKVTDRSLRIREGVVFVREMTMTFANIQNISIAQGPLQRYFGIADLKVSTAGGGSGGPEGQQQMFNMHTGFFRGVDNAQEIRDLMLERLRKLRSTGLGDLDDADDSPDQHPAEQTADGQELIGLLRAIRDEAKLFRQAVREL